MKAGRKIASALRIIGWVLIGLAVAVSIYTLATSGGPWGSFNSTFKAEDENLNIFDRVRFGRQYYSALNDAAKTKGQVETLRVNSIRSYFSDWEGRLAEAKAKNALNRAEEFYTGNADSLTADDAKEFLTWFEQVESSEETRQLKEVFEYLDGLAKPAAGKGKLAKLQAASMEPVFRTFYESFAAEHGEEAGEFLEFTETVAAMIRQDLAAGETVADVKTYLQKLDYTRYTAALAELRIQERDKTEDIRDAYAAEMEKLAAGEKADVRGYYEALYASVPERYPDESVPDKDVFLNTVRALLTDGKFDGSFNSLMKSVRSAMTAVTDSSAAGVMNSFSRATMQTSDQNNSLGFFRVLWTLSANLPVLWGAGILLLIIAAVLDKLISKITLARLEHAGIQEDDDILLRVNHLKQYFRSGNYINKAVDDVSFYIKKGEVFGLVGESGCGKTTTGRTIINLYDPTEGDVYFQGLRISSTQNGLPVLTRSLRNEFKAAKARMEAELKEKCAANPEQKASLTEDYNQKLSEMRKELHDKIRDAKTNALESSVEKSKCVEKYREKRKAELTAQYEQDMKTLTGKAAEDRKARYEIDMKVAGKDNIMTKMQMIFQDPIASINPRMTVREIIAEGLKIRGIKDEKYIDEKVYEVLDLVGLVREHAARYPHEFSGGQRQRIGIARAIVLQPDLIIADEPISALDVSIQAQVINLLNDLRNKMGLTIMFIAHNLSVVKYFSDRIGVMYYGHLVELTTSDELFAHPLHPYTKSLLSAIPYPDPHHEKHRKRIEYDPYKAHDYSVDQPTLREIRPGHFIRCNDAEFEAYKKELGI